MKKNAVNLIAAVGGLVLAAVGFVLLKAIPDPQGILLPLPYLCIGLGCGIFGYGTGELLSARALRKHPETARQIAVESKDERNIALSNRAKAKAFDRMLTIFGALMIAFALMGVDVAAVLLLVAAYLFVVGCMVYYRLKYEKEM